MEDLKSQDSRAGEIQRIIKDKVAVITINRPPHNFTDTLLMQKLADELEVAQNSPETISVALIRSGAKHFCAGANFKESEVTDFSSATRDFYQQAERILSSTIPIITAIKGGAIGAGLGLALSGEFRIACDSAFVSAPFVKLGIHPGFALSFMLPKLIGLDKAAKVLLTGNKITAKDALDLGIFDEVVSDSELDDRAFLLAKEIAQGSPLALRSIKKTLRSQVSQNFSDIFEYELSRQAELIQTEDAKIGIASSITGEPPKFLGR